MKDYDDGKIRVREAKNEDIERIARDMRQGDKDEIWASNHLAPVDAIRIGMQNSVYCRVIENGSPIAMFGICPVTIIGDHAVIWMLGTNGLDKIKIKFLRNCRAYIDTMLAMYDYLDNYVDVRNTKSIAWLKFLGARFDEPRPYGAENMMFQHFSFSRK